MKSYVVVGLGRFGSEVARQLYLQGCEVLAMDMSSELVQQVSPDVTHAVVADGRDKEVLKALGVRNFDCGIVAIGDDLAASVLATMNLKELGLSYVVCKAHDDTHRKVLEKLGADRVVIPEQENAARLAKSLSTPNVLEYIELSEEFGIMEIEPRDSWIGKTIRTLELRSRYGANVIALRRGEKISIPPDIDAPLDSDCALVILGSYEALEKMKS